MSESTLQIGLVLPDVLGTYGDSGNALVLRRRALLRGIDAKIVEIHLGEPVPESLDLYTVGGAEDYAQRLAAQHLSRFPGMQQAAQRGKPVLAICAAIQVLGNWYQTASGERVDGLGMLDLTTVPQTTRSIGEISVRPTIDGLTETLSGFENHGGATALGSGSSPLGTVLTGDGNVQGQTHEGAVTGTVFGTYLHGPVLARNPQLADHLLAIALGVDSLEPLELPEVDRLRRERLRTARKLAR